MGLFSLYLKLAMQRQQLSEMIEKYGYKDPRVIAQSRKVDQLVVELQKRRLAG